MRQWQCPCGEWVDMSHTSHVHYSEFRQPTLGEIIAMRTAGKDDDALTPVADPTITKWQPDFPRRDKPNDSP